MSAIADRSGTGKPTIYLRWPDRRHVMAAAIADLDGGEPHEPDGAALPEALEAAVRDDRELLVTGPEAAFLRAALFESGADAMIAEALEQRILAPRRERLRRILERGADDGAVREGIDAGAFADLLQASLVSAMVLGEGGPDPLEIARQAGLAVAGAVPAGR
jgi:AcrR family transcriptional regulator